MAYTKECDCIACGNPGPSIVHHAEGATFKHNKVLVGHWFVLPLCQACDDVITQGSRKAFREKFGPQSELWIKYIRGADCSTKILPPFHIYEAIGDWGK